MTLQISQRVLDLGEKARQGLAEQFARIDAIAEENTARVLSAFQKHGWQRVLCRHNRVRV